MGLSSLFGKKKPGGKTAPDSSDFPADQVDSSGWRKGRSPFDSARKTAEAIAQATAQKIDKIELEMSREAPKHRGVKGTAGGEKGGPPRPVQQVASTYVGSVITPTRRWRSASDSTAPFFSHSTDILLDDTTLSNAIELSDSISNPAIEESAILYSYGDLAPAIEVLKTSIQPDQSNVRNPQAWLMLLELYEAIGNSEEFDRLSAAYTRQFNLPSSPEPEEPNTPTIGKLGAQRGTVENQTDDTSDVSDLAGIAFDGPLNASIVERLEHLKRLASVHRVLYVDFSKITGVETQGAELVLRMLAAFAKSNRTLVLRGSDHLLAKVVAAVEAGRSQVASFIWELMFDLFRLTGRQAEFDKKSVDYLAVFEGSLPAWEPYPGHVRIDPAQASSRAGGPAENVSPPPPTSIALKGVLVGKADRQLVELTAFAETTTRVCVDCSALKRIDFTAAGALLNWAVGLQKHNKTAEFRSVSHLVSALLIVMGIHEVALVERR